MKNTRLLALVLLLAAAVAVLFRFWGVVMMFFVAAIIAYLLNPLVKLLTIKGKLPRGLAVVVTVLLVLGLFTYLLTLAIPYAVTQITGVIGDLRVYADGFNQLVDQAGETLASWHLPQQVLDWGEEWLGNSDVYLTRILNGALAWLMNTTMGVFDVIVVVILVIYFMLDGATLLERLLRALPDAAEKRVRRVVIESNHRIWKYVGSRVLISLGMSIVSYIGFTIMGLHYAVLFAVLSFILDFIPYFGSLIAGAIEAVFALITGGVSLMIKTAVFVLVVQQIEGNVVAPKIQGDAVNVHPLGVMFSLLICSEVWGPVGMLISTPLAAVVKATVHEVYDFIIERDAPPAQVCAAAGGAGAAPPAPAASQLSVPVESADKPIAADKPQEGPEKSM